MARSLNNVELIGNLTKDPELRYTPQGTAVCSLSIATNRSWTNQQGAKQEETEYHRLVAWNKLAELCSQLLTKGRKVYVKGRLNYRKYTNKENQEVTVAEIIIDDIRFLDSKGEKTEQANQETPAHSEPTSDEIANDIPF